MDFKRILVLLFLVFCAMQSYGQQEQNNIDFELSIKARRTNEDVLIRWAPMNAETWRHGNTYGYLLERFEVDTNFAFEDRPYLKLIESPIKPISLEKLKDVITKNEDNEFLLVAGECIYGVLESQETDGKQAMSNEEENRYTMAMLACEMDGLTAVAAGLRFIDKNVDINKEYVYKVSLIGEDGSVVALKAMRINPSKYQTPVPYIENIVERENSISIQWNIERHVRAFSSYYILRSEDGVRYKSLTDKPFVQGVGDDVLDKPLYYNFTDSVPNYKKYYYKIIGIDLFAIKSPFSNVVTGMGRDVTAPDAPVNVQARLGEDNKVHLSWDYEEDKKDPVEFKLNWSNEVSDGFEVIETINSELREFVTPKYNPSMTNFFSISAVDTAGNIASSARRFLIIRDTIPPNKPINVTGTIDSLGVVNLTWEQNKEQDLMAYQVFFANRPDMPFANLTAKPVTSNGFQDTVSLNNLGKHLYYKVVALDWNWHQSSMSDFVKIKKPDFISPSAPLISSYKMTKEGVKLKWIPSSSNDVVQHLITRINQKTDEKTNFEMNVDTGEFSFIDSDMEYNYWYVYEITATDDSGNISQKPSFIRVFAKDLRPKQGVKNLAFGEAESVQKLSWNFEGKEASKFEIYQNKTEDKFFMLAKISSDKREYILKRAKEKTKYKIRVIYSDGTKSPMSDVIEI